MRGSSSGTTHWAKPSLTRRVKEHLFSVDVQPDDATTDVLDLVSDLVDSMLSDPLVHPEVSSGHQPASFVAFP